MWFWWCAIPIMVQGPLVLLSFATCSYLVDLKVWSLSHPCSLWVYPATISSDSHKVISWVISEDYFCHETLIASSNVLIWLKTWLSHFLYDCCHPIYSLMFLFCGGALLCPWTNKAFSSPFLVGLAHVLLKLANSLNFKEPLGNTRTCKLFLSDSWVILHCIALQWLDASSFT